MAYPFNLDSRHTCVTFPHTFGFYSESPSAWSDLRPNARPDSMTSVCRRDDSAGPYTWKLIRTLAAFALEVRSMLVLTDDRTNPKARHCQYTAIVTYHECAIDCAFCGASSHLTVREFSWQSTPAYPLCHVGSVRYARTILDESQVTRCLGCGRNHDSRLAVTH